MIRLLAVATVKVSQKFTGSATNSRSFVLDNWPHFNYLMKVDAVAAAVATDRR